MRRLKRFILCAALLAGLMLTWTALANRGGDGKISFQETLAGVYHQLRKLQASDLPFILLNLAMAGILAIVAVGDLKSYFYPAICLSPFANVYYTMAIIFQ
ncbi:MAG: hypothetical protein EXR62_05375 [Chloroflexi bacterium]|nr:hypothetical protein [Chloroflexota bacterium]